jgi:hypothetical protein
MEPPNERQMPWKAGPHQFTIPLKAGHGIVWNEVAARLARALVTIVGKEATQRIVAAAVLENQR